MKMVWRAVLAVVLGTAMLPNLSQSAQAATMYTLTGTVTGLNASGAEVGIGGVDVQMWSPEGPTPNWVDVDTVTASDGTYSVTVPRTGDYSYYAYCDGDCSGYADTRVDEVSVTGDTTQDMHLSLLTTLTLIVKDNAGDPITRPLDVAAYSAAGNGDDITVTGPSTAGAYTLTSVAADTSISLNDDLDGTPVYENWSTDYPPRFLDDSSDPQTRTITLGPWTGIRARAVTPDGTPLNNVRWNVFTRNPDTNDWDQGNQAGPLLTDDDGRMNWAGTIGSSYKFCFYDDDYQYNTRSERYADTCWTDSPTAAGATVWTPTEASPVLDPTITLQSDGHSLTVGHPWVDGTAKVGQPLTVRPGTWGPDGVALTYQWVADESADIAPIAGATGTTFTPTAAQAGKAIGVQVTGTLESYRTYTAYRRVGTVGGTTPTMDGSLTISGAPMPGNTVTAVPGTLTPAGTSVSYDWYVDGETVDSTGDGSTLDITPAMAGGSLEVDMTAYDWDCCDDQLYASAQTTVGGGVVGTRPSISGETIVGSTLQAHDGTWGPTGVSLAHQWLRDGEPIDAATAATYALTTADIGAKLSVEVSGTLAGGYPAVSKTSEATASVQGVLTAATPTISGAPTVGETLTAGSGQWGPAGVDLAYQWYAGGAVIQGATGSTYELTAAEVGQAITVTVTGTLADYVTQAKTSDATDPIEGVLTWATPTVPGEAVVGEQLTADPGPWGPSGVDLAYQWLRGGTEIAGATGSTYTLTGEDIGSTIAVRVTGTLADYAPKTTTSDPTSKVLDVFVNPPAPTVTGTAAGNTLTVDAGDWGVDGVTFTYQWLRDGVTIDEATAATYDVTAADRGHGISVRVTGKRDGYVIADQISAPTAITGVFTISPTPTISGTTTVGGNLTVRAGSWSPTPAFAYQWFRNGKAIVGATRTTYKLVAADAGARITVRVTASRTGYETVSTTSNATAPITRLFAKTSKPKIKGKAKVGKKLTANPGKWSPKPNYHYQWIRNGKAIKGATHATYKLTKPDRGKRIKVRVTARRSGFVTVIKTSKATTRVKR